MSEYTPSEARICIDFCNAAMKRSRPDGTFMSMEEADAAFTRWLAEHDRQVAERAWDEGYGSDEECHTPRRNPYRKEQENTDA